MDWSWKRLAKAISIVVGIAAVLGVFVGSMAIADHFLGEGGFLIPSGIVFFVGAVFAFYMGLEDEDD